MKNFNHYKEMINTPYRERHGVKLGNNVRMFYDIMSKCIHIWYHNTVIIEISKNNVYTLTTGGWYSVSTFSNLNKLCPFYISRKSVGNRCGVDLGQEFTYSMRLKQFGNDFIEII